MVIARCWHPHRWVASEGSALSRALHQPSHVLPQVKRAKAAGVVAFKLYPAGATTNSDSGVTDIQLVMPTLRAMAQVRRAFKLLDPVDVGGFRQGAGAWPVFLAGVPVRSRCKHFYVPFQHMFSQRLRSIQSLEDSPGP